MNIIGKTLTAFVALSLLAGPAAAEQEDSSGMVVASRGEVIALSNGGSRELKQGDFIYVNDEIITTLIIETYLYNGDENDAATLSLVEGGLRVITGAMAKSNPENYKVRTPVALMGVRGTEFSVVLCGDQVCGEEQLPE